MLASAMTRYACSCNRCCYRLEIILQWWRMWPPRMIFPSLPWCPTAAAKKTYHTPRLNIINKWLLAVVDDVFKKCPLNEMTFKLNRWHVEKHLCGMMFMHAWTYDKIDNKKCNRCWLDKHKYRQHAKDIEVEQATRYNKTRRWCSPAWRRLVTLVVVMGVETD